MIQINQELREVIVDRIVSVAHPERIILFGSRGRGTGHLGSDIDLLVIARSDQPRYRRAASIYGVLSDILAPMDILVYSPQEVEQWSRVPQAFVTTAIREGVVLYDKASLTWSEVGFARLKATWLVPACAFPPGKPSIRPAFTPSRRPKNASMRIS